LKRELMPLARVVTPNIPEAERITGMSIRDGEAMVEAARAIRGMGARAVLVKGGHLAGRSALDVLDEDGKVTYFDAERVDTTSTHGTGCTLAAAIASCLARGHNVEDSVALAKRFVTEAIRRAPRLGRGHGPINHSVAAGV
jgi:hydroxymethylpyrimidine kinase/phosphomethylpyrimidine kinase